MARILIAGVSSGSGKTTVTCGLLQILQNRGLTVQALKCGPDYIDPMFHSRIIGAPSGNLDPFFLKDDVLRWLLQKRESNADLTVLEGVMGYYDGIGFTCRYSSWSLACATQTPVVLVLDCKGMGVSLGAVLKGFLEYQTPHQIAGVIFNRMSASLYPAAAQMATRLGIQPLGYFPQQKNWNLESRHLGLVTAEEVTGLQGKVRHLALQMEQTVDIEGLITLAKTAASLENVQPYPVQRLPHPVKIAVAADRAFCFTYPDNLELLRKMGCVLLPFSPLEDTALPRDIDGLLLSGGYPELYAAQLSQNKAMRTAVRTALERGLPCIAECGGFLYLHEVLEAADGNSYPMVGAISGVCRKGDRLRRFGYVTVTAKNAQLLSQKQMPLKAHEFHYWQSENNSTDFHVEKVSGTDSWDCGVGTETLYAGFPHFYFYGNPGMAERFTERCRRYGLERTNQADSAVGR